MTETVCERCKQPVMVVEKQQYRAQTIYSYECSCGHKKTWKGMPNGTITSVPRDRV